MVIYWLEILCVFIARLSSPNHHHHPPTEAAAPYSCRRRSSSPLTPLLMPYEYTIAKQARERLAGRLHCMACRHIEVIWPALFRRASQTESEWGVCIGAVNMRAVWVVRVRAGRFCLSPFRQYRLHRWLYRCHHPTTYAKKTPACLLTINPIIKGDGRHSVSINFTDTLAWRALAVVVNRPSINRRKWRVRGRFYRHHFGWHLW